MAVLMVTIGVLGSMGLIPDGYMGYAVFAAVFGFGGSYISLLLSKTLVKKTMGVRLIQQDTTNQFEKWYYNTIEHLAIKSNLPMPEVGIYEGQANAFATGSSKSNSLVAISTGLMEAMDKEEIEAVLAHEMSHISNGDMMVMTLIQGALNTMVIFLARIIGGIVDKVVLKNDKGWGVGYYVTVFVLEILLGFVAQIIAAWFSRKREYKADSGAGELVGNHKMIKALQKLQMLQEGQIRQSSNRQLDEKIAALGIGAGKKAINLFASHPPLEDRIEALKQ